MRSILCELVNIGEVQQLHHTNNYTYVSGSKLLCIEKYVFYPSCKYKNDNNGHLFYGEHHQIKYTIKFIIYLLILLRDRSYHCSHRNAVRRVFRRQDARSGHGSCALPGNADRNGCPHSWR